MAGEWPTTRVDELADSISETHNFGKNELIFLNTSDILYGKILHHNYSPIKEWPGQAKKSICRDDILFSEIRPANGRYAYIDIDAKDYVVSTKLMVIRAKKGLIIPRFLYHFLTSKKTTEWLQLLAESRSGTFPQITFEQVAELEIPLPPKLNQMAIVAFLDTIEKKIGLNRRMNRTLEAMARAVFKSWFVDFDPVHAKACSGQQPSLSPHIADLFPDAFEVSDLGEIPRGWKTGVLEDLFMLQRGFDLPEKKRIPGPYQVIAASGPSTYHNEAKVKGPGVVTGRSGVLGKVFFIQDDFWPLNTTLWVKRYNKSLPCYAYFLLQTFDLSIFNAGSAVPTLNRNHIHNLPVILPDYEVIKHFEALVGLLFKRQKTNEEETNTLSAIRDALLPKLISGELAVPEAERIVARCI